MLRFGRQGSLLEVFYRTRNRCQKQNYQRVQEGHVPHRHQGSTRGLEDFGQAAGAPAHRQAYYGQGHRCKGIRSLPLDEEGTFPVLQLRGRGFRGYGQRKSPGARRLQGVPAEGNHADFAQHVPIHRQTVHKIAIVALVGGGRIVSIFPDRYFLRLQCR